MTVVVISELSFDKTLFNWLCMKEARMCLSEMELIQGRCMSCEDRQMLGSKDVSKDPKKHASLGTEWDGVGGILPCKAINLVFFYIFCYRYLSG